MTKHADQMQLREGRLYWAYKSRPQPMISGKSRQEIEQLVTLHTQLRTEQ